jgi:hypothetical protein
LNLLEKFTDSTQIFTIVKMTNKITKMKLQLAKMKTHKQVQYRLKRIYSSMLTLKLAIMR